MPSERDDLWIQVEPITRGAEARIVRVFVSSTFRDMEAERDVLMKHVFPALRNRSRERRLEFVAVDLRWGITAEQVEKGELLPLILGEIDRCRPYFLGLLGHYYGYEVPQVPIDVRARYPWLKDAEGTSITELEILYGVLDHPESTQQSVFFFRGQEYIDQLPPDLRESWRSQGDSAAKLLKLKNRIHILPRW